MEPNLTVWHVGVVGHGLEVFLFYDAFERRATVGLRSGADVVAEREFKDANDALRCFVDLRETACYLDERILGFLDEFFGAAKGARFESLSAMDVGTEHPALVLRFSNGKSIWIYREGEGIGISADGAFSVGDADGYWRGVVEREAPALFQLWDLLWPPRRGPSRP